jgi:hypothetical protein
LDIPAINVPASADEISSVFEEDETRVLFEGEIDLSTIPFPSMGMLDLFIAQLKEAKINKVELQNVRLEVLGELQGSTIPYHMAVGGTLIITTDDEDLNSMMNDFLGGIQVEFAIDTELEKQ